MRCMSHERSHLFCPDSAPIEGVLENVAGVHPLDPSLEKSACVPMRRVDTFRATHESELDTETGRAIVDLLFELNQTSGTTLVVVTHDEKLAARCSKILRLAEGRLLQ